MHDLIVMGLGELGQLYASAALKSGMRVTPVTRAMQPDSALQEAPRGTPVLVAVGEADLDTALASLARDRLDCIILLQNELFPAHWRRFTQQATVMVPWLLKKKGEPLLVARSTPVFGRHAELVCQLHHALGFGAERLANETALQQAIVDKYAFILAVNALGLLEDITLGEWLEREQAGASDGTQHTLDSLAREAAALGVRLATEGTTSRATDLDIESSIAQVRAGMAAMAGMRAKGRTAKDRVRRAIAHAQRFGLATPRLVTAASS